MESAISSLILFTVFLFAVLTFSHNNLVSEDVLALSEQRMETRLIEQARTDLSVVDARTTGAGEMVEMTLRNSGSVLLADYERWDVIVEYGYHPESEPDPDARSLAINRLTYSPAALGENQWNVRGIYVDALALAPETFDLGIVNPGEEVVIQMMVAPSVALTTTNRATVAVANGTHVSAFFMR